MLCGFFVFANSTSPGPSFSWKENEGGAQLELVGDDNAVT